MPNNLIEATFHVRYAETDQMGVVHHAAAVEIEVGDSHAIPGARDSRRFRVTSAGTPESLSLEDCTRGARERMPRGGNRSISSVYAGAGLGRRSSIIPKGMDNDAFHRDDFVRQLGARCAVVLVPQAVRNAAGGQKRRASGGAYRVAGGVAALARCSTSRCAPRLPGRPDPLP